MKNIYTKEFLKNTLDMIGDNLSDLEMWSTYNDDEFNEEIADLEKALRKIKEKRKP